MFNNALLEAISLLGLEASDLQPPTTNVSNKESAVNCTWTLSRVLKQCNHAAVIRSVNVASCLDSHSMQHNQLALTSMNVPSRAILCVRWTLIASTQKAPTNVFLKKVPEAEMTVVKTRDSWTCWSRFFGYDQYFSGHWSIDFVPNPR